MLARYLRTMYLSGWTRPHCNTGRTSPRPFESILELGAGTGLAGLAAAAIFQNARVTLTDLEEALPALRANVIRNPSISARVEVRECNWLAPPKELVQGKFDCILVADCVWLEELVPPLVNVLEMLLTQQDNNEAMVIMSYQSRSRRVDALLFGLLRKFAEIKEIKRLPQERPRGKIELFSVELKDQCSGDDART